MAEIVRMKTTMSQLKSKVASLWSSLCSRITGAEESAKLGDVALKPVYAGYLERALHCRPAACLC